MRAERLAPLRDRARTNLVRPVNDAASGELGNTAAGTVGEMRSQSLGEACRVEVVRARSSGAAEQ